MDTATAYGRANVPPEQAFEFLTFRDPALSGSQYLYLGGHGTGSYSADEANAIAFVTLGGERWLWGGGRVGGRVATVHKHNSVVVIRDGECGPLPAYARLEQAGASNAWGFARTALLGYSGADWRRTVLNVPDECPRGSAAAVSGVPEVRWALGMNDGRVVLLGHAGGEARELSFPGRVFALCAQDLDGDGAAEIVAGTGAGQVQAFDGAGRRRFVADVGEAVSSPYALAADAAATGPRIWAGTVNGRLVALDAAGRVAGDYRLAGCLDHVLIHAADRAVLAVTAEGRAAAFSADEPAEARPRDAP